MHFAASKNVGESVKDPFLYYQNNIRSTLNLIEVSNNIYFPASRKRVEAQFVGKKV